MIDTDNLKIWEDCSKEHGALIEQVVKFNRFKVCVEVGVAYGTTTAYIAKGAQSNGGQVFGFDLWQQHGLKNQFIQISSKQLVEKYLSGLGLNNVSLFQVNSKTQEFKDLLNQHCPRIDFAFIDGCHSYEGISNDFSCIYPLLNEYGIVCFHDTRRIDGCREFVIDLRTKYNDGTFDIIDLPFGLDRRDGVSMLVKRSLPLMGGLGEVCGSPSDFDGIYNKEREWYKNELNRFGK